MQLNIISSNSGIKIDKNTFFVWTSNRFCVAARLDESNSNTALPLHSIQFPPYTLLNTLLNKNEYRS